MHLESMRRNGSITTLTKMLMLSQGTLLYHLLLSRIQSLYTSRSCRLEISMQTTSSISRTRLTPPHPPPSGFQLG